jgi:hypothetical protein
MQDIHAHELMGCESQPVIQVSVNTDDRGDRIMVNWALQATLSLFEQSLFKHMHIFLLSTHIEMPRMLRDRCTLVNENSNISISLCS